MIGLCERFHCLPSQLYEEEAELLRLLQVHQKGHPEKSEPSEEGEEWPE